MHMMIMKTNIAILSLLLLSPFPIKGLFQRKAASAEERTENVKDVYNSEPLAATLSNDEKIPYIGLGLGNLQEDRIPEIIESAFSSTAPHPTDENIEINGELGYRLIDTAKKSGNEATIAERLSNVVFKNRSLDPNYKTTIHFVTKVWYTHLGYERTKLSIRESMDALLKPFEDMYYATVKIHMLIHWPRCMNGIEWMNCIQEEEELPPNVRELKDIEPHKNPNAYLPSWHAMEDMYNEHFPVLASIGISNFETDDLNILIQSARIKPHVFQGNLETVSQVLPILREYNIHPQCFGILGALTSQRPVPKLDVARRQLMTLAEELNAPDENEEFKTHPSSVLLSFLMKRNIGVMARTSSLQNLAYNSPQQVLEVPDLTHAQGNRVLHVLDSIQYHWNLEEENNKFVKSGEKVHVSFHNMRDAENPLRIEFVGFRDEKVDDPQVVAEKVWKAETVTLESHPGHLFTVYDAVTDEELTQFEVTKDYGRAEWFSVEL